MQRKSYAALFAALVIGIGAIDGDAAEVRSVTVVAPDSGTVLGIGGEITVQAVVRDFTPHAADGVVIALFSQGVKGLLADNVKGLLADNGEHLLGNRGDGDGTGSAPATGRNHELCPHER